LICSQRDARRHNIHSGLQVWQRNTEPLAGEFKKLVEDLALVPRSARRCIASATALPLLDLRFFSTGVSCSERPAPTSSPLMENLSAVIESGCIAREPEGAHGSTALLGRPAVSLPLDDGRELLFSAVRIHLALWLTPQGSRSSSPASFRNHWILLSAGSPR